ncbi:RES domain-containing protein [Rubrobacter marinus]|uniref:RES domain-containing protein n=1 Tax=Rubrobacter marinus TaxID=2653852 RepID=A0A6G8PVS3_9ACTN|nr:RES domain-containing protein [Rubrobacter marinus]QIN78296.1 RES domain-containing protein [Rubrobacter marinus]
MVVVDLPPPRRRPNPLFHDLPSGSRLVRLFDPSRHGATETGFRSYGPLLRFDHHLGDEDGTPGEDAERGIYYAARTLSGCLVEIFGDTGVVDLDRHHIASPILRRDLRLLDLRHNGAMRAGTKAAIAKVSERQLSQTWSRHFYETPEVYGEVDGVLYLNAHNDEDAIALYERASGALECPPERVMTLDDEVLRAAVLEAADDNDLVVADA